MTDLPAPPAPAAQAPAPQAIVIHYSHSGQTLIAAKAFARGFERGGGRVEAIGIEPLQSQPFPWSFIRFFDRAPEAALGQGEDIAPFVPAGSSPAAILVICYPVWFLAPAPAVARALASAAARKLVSGRDVITVSTARAMWGEAQNAVAGQIASLGGNLIGHVPLPFANAGPLSFLSAPIWLLTGCHGPFLRGLIPAAGIDMRRVAAMEQVAQLVAAKRGAGPMAIEHDRPDTRAERIGLRYFRWTGRLMQRLGPGGSRARRIFVPFMVLGLVALIVTVLPVLALSRLVSGRSAKAKDSLISLRFAGGHCTL